MNIEHHIEQLRRDLDIHIAALDSMRSRLRGAGVLSAVAAQAAVDLRRVSGSLMTDATALAQVQRVAAIDARASLNIPKV